MKKLFFLSLLLLPICLFGQTSLTGTIKNSNTKEPLPFATIITNNGLGEICDADGKFSIISKQIVTELTISYVGFKTQKVPIKPETRFITILLEPKTESLNEVVVKATEDPALPIIRKVIRNKNRNDIKKVLNSFEYRVYNKLLVTANPDSINGKLDSVFVTRNDKKVLKILIQPIINSKDKSINSIYI